MHTIYMLPKQALVWDLVASQLVMVTKEGNRISNGQKEEVLGSGQNGQGHVE